MFVILTYDIGVKRVRKVLSVCRRYLHHVQRSVLEGQITEKRLKSLMSKLEKIIEPSHDAICIYLLESPRFTKRIEIGRTTDRSNVI